MRVLWTLLKVVLALVLVLPVAIIVLGTALGIFGALLGLAILALKIAVFGVIAWGAFKLLARLLRGPTRTAPVPPKAIQTPAPLDPYYEAALRELDREVPVR